MDPLLVALTKVLHTPRVGLWGAGKRVGTGCWEGSKQTAQGIEVLVRIQLLAGRGYVRFLRSQMTLIDIFNDCIVFQTL